MTDLNALAYEHLLAAREGERGRSAELVLHDGELRQSLIALTEHSVLPEHNSPPAGSIQVLVGRIRVATGQGIQRDIRAGELWLLSHERHEVTALEDAAFLLTTVTGVGRDSFS
ncbi:cupin domain-containing protein [Gulosibacter chungangensis]|uniref:Cupin n=1 Tax=Gulosibacter chungangensis TaxID=979746 RepID=A0A7J5BAM8_9MICO|nr:cupin [Gulosibacter chungangensis]KAB1643111.1 cupin [Gulosibacter chungangensis]